MVTQTGCPLSCLPQSLQVGSQPALEALPLILEPESRMYCSPVVVLDFQSLYPSLVIAYNLCYTTCLGRQRHADASGCARGKGGRISRGVCGVCGWIFVSSGAKAKRMPPLCAEASCPSVHIFTVNLYGI